MLNVESTDLLTTACTHRPQPPFVRHALQHTTPALRIRLITGRTPIKGKRLTRPDSESVGLQSSSAGVRSRELVLLGSLHVELSSWRRGNPPPPSAARATIGTGGSGGGLVRFAPTPEKSKGTRGNHTHLQQCAPPPVLEQVDGRLHPVFKGIGGRPPIPGIEPPPSRQAPDALPLERLPSERHRHPAHGSNTQGHTPTTHAGATALPTLLNPCMAVC